MSRIMGLEICNFMSEIQASSLLLSVDLLDPSQPLNCCYNINLALYNRYIIYSKEQCSILALMSTLMKGKPLTPFR